MTNKLFRVRDDKSYTDYYTFAETYENAKIKVENHIINMNNDSIFGGEDGNELRLDNELPKISTIEDLSENFV